MLHLLKVDQLEAVMLGVARRTAKLGVDRSICVCVLSLLFGRSTVGDHTNCMPCDLSGATLPVCAVHEQRHVVLEALHALVDEGPPCAATGSAVTSSVQRWP